MSSSTNHDEIVLQLRAELSQVQTNLVGLLVQHNTTLEQYSDALARLNSIRLIAHETQPSVARAAGQHSPQELDEARRRRQAANTQRPPRSPQELDEARRRRQAANTPRVLVPVQQVDDSLRRHRDEQRPATLEQLAAATQREHEEARQRAIARQQQRDARAAQFARSMAAGRAAAQERRRLAQQFRMTPPTVKVLAAKKLDEPMADACGICLETHTMRDGLHTSCGHCFGAACMKSYLEHPYSKTACPICRAPNPKRTTYRPRAAPKKRAPKPVETPVVPAAAVAPNQVFVEYVFDNAVPMEIPETPFLRGYLQRQTETV